MEPEVLDASTWRPRAAAHAARLAPYVQPHLARRRRGEKHPVHDFLFSYYAHRPAQLLRWHPGVGTRLRDAAEHDRLSGYVDGTVEPAYAAFRRPMLEASHRLLMATAARTVHTGCFGLHEWAMVYRTGATRHPRPLRLGSSGTDTVVESHRITCSHFDAFRFFTPAARPRNTLQPSSDDRPDFEQPGCLHAGMDLYKHAFRLSPMVCSDLVADAFELAWDIRVLDMRAAPYDLSGLTLDPTGEPWTPVRIEAPDGKQEYVAAQRGFAERAQVIRRQLVSECERLLSVLGDARSSTRRHDGAVPRTDSASRVIAAHPDRVFAALVDPDAIAAWLPPTGMSGRFEHFDARPGGSYRLVLTYEDSATGPGKTTADSDVVDVDFVEILPGVRVVQAVSFVAEDPDLSGTMTMTWEVTSAGDGTRVDIRAEQVPSGISAEDHAAGLASSLANLAAHVERRTT